MEKPTFEVLHLAEDIVSSSGCPDVCVKLCGTVVCNAECATFCRPECGSVYDF